MAKFPKCENVCDRIATASIEAKNLFENKDQTYYDVSSVLCFECAGEYVKHWSPDYMGGWTDGRIWSMTITQIVGEE